MPPGRVVREAREPSARDGRTTRESPRRDVTRGQQRDGTGEFAPGGHECPIRPRPLDRRPERSSLRSNYSVSTALVGRPRADTERARKPGAARTRRRRGSWSTRRESRPTAKRRDSTRHRTRVDYSRGSARTALRTGPATSSIGCRRELSPAGHRRAERLRAPDARRGGRVPSLSTVLRRL